MGKGLKAKKGLEKDLRGGAFQPDSTSVGGSIALIEHRSLNSPDDIKYSDGMDQPELATSQFVSPDKFVSHGPGKNFNFRGALTGLPNESNSNLREEVKVLNARLEEMTIQNIVLKEENEAYREEISELNFRIDKLAKDFEKVSFSNYTNRQTIRERSVDSSSQMTERKDNRIKKLEKRIKDLEAREALWMEKARGADKSDRHTSQGSHGQTLDRLKKDLQESKDSKEISSMLSKQKIEQYEKEIRSLKTSKLIFKFKNSKLFLFWSNQLLKSNLRLKSVGKKQFAKQLN